MNPRTKRTLGNIRGYFRRLRMALTAGLPNDWESTEQHVRMQLRPSIEPHRQLARDLDDLAFALLQSIRELRQPQVLFGAHAALMVRVLEDLRVCCLTAEAGYTMQTWTVAASCFEAAHTIGFLAVSPDRASAWWAHSDTEQAFCSAKAGIEGSYKFLDLGRKGT